ncbi:hypothetical protein ACJX0J_032350 [Zea mays]
MALETFLAGDMTKILEKAFGLLTRALSLSLSFIHDRIFGPINIFPYFYICMFFKPYKARRGLPHIFDTHLNYTIYKEDRNFIRGGPTNIIKKNCANVAAKYIDINATIASDLMHNIPNYVNICDSLKFAQQSAWPMTPAIDGGEPN